MTYVQDARAALVRRLPRPLEDGLVDLYTLLVLRVGQRASREDVHDAWAVWRSAQQPDHGSVVPLGELGEDVRASDDPYVEAIRRAAADLAAGGAA